MVGRPVRLDPHVHTRDSYDGHEPVELLLEHASEIGLDGIVVTDHDAIDASLHAAELAPDYGLLGIPGVEVSTAAGHLLALGVEECPASGRPLDETVDEVEALGGAAVVPHPFQRSRHGVPKRVILDCDGVETLNACSVLDVRNEQARRFATERGYPRFGGSDAHVASEVGRAYTEVAFPGPVDDPATVDAAAVLATLRRGETRAGGRRSRRSRSIRKYAWNARVKSVSIAKSPVGVAGTAASLLGRGE